MTARAATRATSSTILATLSRLIADNAIGYFQDKALAGWTFGYYLNNASFRTVRVLCLLCGVPQEDDLRAEAMFSSAHIRNDREVVKHAEEFLRQWKHGIVDGDNEREWEVCYRATTAAFSLLRCEG